MSFRIFAPLITLLGMTSINNAQFGTCDYNQVMEVGITYHIFNPNFPYGNYPAGSACRWVAKSDHPINMTCNIFRLPEDSRCRVDYLYVQTSTERARRYCGNRGFSIVTMDNQIKIELHSSFISRGGQFYCTLKAVTNDKQCRCGWKNPTRIAGGEETGVNEYPMMAGLINSVEKIIFCGGTIINNKQILTAAHCINDRDIKNVGVVIGEHDTQRGNDTNATIVYRADNFIIHPNYSVEVEDYDIAIVSINGIIEFNQLVGPACLPLQYLGYTFVGRYVDILGWGSLGFAEGTSNTLQKVQVQIVSNTECSKYYELITDRQMCTLEKDKDACQFDSGGPVLWINPLTKRVVLLSVVSYGLTCADGVPGVNSRVEAYINWILEHKPRGFEYCK